MRVHSMTTGEWNVVEILVLLGIVFAMWGALLLPVEKSERDPNKRAGQR